MRRAKRIVAISLVSMGLAGLAYASDLAVSRYQVVSPSGDIYRGAEVTFEVDAENNDLIPISDAEVEIAVSPTMVVRAENLPGTCVASGFSAPQTLTCAVPTLIRDGANPDYTLSFVATAETANALASTVTISSPSNTDLNATNDSLTITPTVSAGADLAIELVASTPNIPASGRYNYAATVTNNGPDSVSDAEVVFALPPSADFGYVSSAGSNWSCAHNNGASQSVTCTYRGGAIASGAPFPQITVVGDADIQSGTLSAQADVTLTQVGLGDPIAANNLDGPEVVTITPGTDLQARILINSSFITGDDGTFTLRINNNGPTSIGAGATITHTLSPHLVLNGSLPPACANNVGVITCTAGALNSGGLENFTIPILADSDTSGNKTISATVAPPAGIVDPVSGNDTGTDRFRVDDPAADVFLQSKMKSPNPVQAGQNMTSTIRIENDGPSIATWSLANPIVITDDLGADETYVSVSTANWSCATGPSPDPTYVTRVTCTTTDSGAMAVDARKTLQIVTQAGATADANIRNNACVDTSGSIVADPLLSNNCRSRASRATTEQSNLSLVSEVSLNSATGYADAVTIPDATTSHFIRLTIANTAGSDTARTVNLTTSDLASWMRQTVNYNGGSVLLNTGVSIFSADAGISCSTLASTTDDIACTITDLLAGETRVLILEVTRPLLSGTRSTSFTLSSPDTVEINTADNGDSVSVTVVENADLIVNDKRVSPNPTQSGGTATYLVDVKNIGANTSANTVVTDFIDPALFELLSVTTTAVGGSCDYGVTTADTATCRMGEVDRGETFQMAITIRPRFPFLGAQSMGDFPVSHTNTAQVTTTTFETDTTNNSRDLVHGVAEPSLDLRVTNDEPTGFAEPSVFPGTLLYEVRVRNGGITQGSGIETTVSPNPPAGYEMAYNGASSNLPAGVSCSQAGNTAPVICSNPDLANSEDVTVTLAFDIIDVGGGDPISSLTFGTTAVITSDQQAFDAPLANNSAAQTTTVIPSTDLELVSKTRISPALPTPINLSEPVQYDIVFRNNGASATTQVRLTDRLPEGFERTATTVVFTPSGSATVTGSSCSSGRTVTCIVDGLFPANGDSVTMTLEAAAIFPFTGDVTDPIVNNVTIAVGQTVLGDPISIDEVSTNNDASTSDGILRVSSISGRVYNDENRNDSFDASEGIGSVELTISGTDLYGNTVLAVVQSEADGSFVFSVLPPSDVAGYAITQTQPSGYLDYQETAGTAAGGVNNASFGNGAEVNTIGGIVLTEGVNETGYLFADYREGEVSGSIYSDLNNNGTRDGSDVGIGSGYTATPHVQITGTDYAGNAVDLTATVDANGAYFIGALPPSDSAGYVLTQLVEPDGYFDGLEENGSGNTLADSINNGEQIDLGVLNPGDQLTDRNFAQVATSSLTGVIYQDDSGDGVRQAGETSTFMGGVVALSGTDDLGRTIECRVTTPASGIFSFPVADCPQLRPGTYALTLISTPGRVPSGATIGTAGGSALTTVISTITISPDTSGTDYLFGVQVGTIVANDNDFTASPMTRIEGGVTPSVFPDDTLNSATFANGDVVVSVLNNGGLTGVRMNADGTLSIPAMAPVGFYTIQYQICEALNSTNCDSALAIVSIVASTIVANDNDFKEPAINGANGGVTPSVFPNDTLNGTSFTDADVIVSLRDDGGLSGIVIDADGTLSVPAGTIAGLYTVGYQICEALDPLNCDPASAEILINPPVILASPDDYSATPVNGAEGGTLPSIFGNDTLNNISFDPADITVSLNGDGGLTGIVLSPDGTMNVPSGSLAGTYSIEYQICEVLNPSNCDTATITITIVIVTDASVAGTVFLDANADNTLQSDETVLPGYGVELRVNDTAIATTETDRDGGYIFEGLDPDLTYELVFTDLRTGTIIGIIGPVNLAPGEDRTGLDEPVHPSGTVYDVVTNEPVIGGTVIVVDEVGQALPAVCFADPSQQGQETSPEGYYFLDIVPGAAPQCPASNTLYRLSVTLPNGLTGVFATNPREVSDGPLDVGQCVNDAVAGPVCEISTNPNRPDASELEPFYAEFTITDGDPEFANNHIPVNSAFSLVPLTAAKRTRSENASVGSIIVYTVTITNDYDVPQVGIDIVDQLPAGFSFIGGSGRMNGQEVEPSVDGRMLSWTGLTVAPRSSVEIVLAVAVGSGATVGEYVNTAYADNGLQDVILSNIAEATVRVTPDEVFDCSEVIGKVFEDENRNGIQDETEEGLPGVRLATVNGLLVTTDEFGRYHIACAATPKPGIGSNFILKLDNRTLPTGYTVTTENPRVMRLTQGKMSQLDFGVAAVRPVEFQVRASAFKSDTSDLTPDALSEVDELVRILRDEASILTIVYLGGTEGGARAQRLKDYVHDLWRETDPTYDLIIETEVVSSSQNP